MWSWTDKHKNCASLCVLSTSTVFILPDSMRLSMSLMCVGKPPLQDIIFGWVEVDYYKEAYWPIYFPNHFCPYICAIPIL